MVITSMDITKINTTMRNTTRAPIIKATSTNRKKMAIMAVITIMTVPAPAPAIMKMNTRKITKSTSTKTLSTKRKSTKKVKHYFKKLLLWPQNLLQTTRTE
jgi:hypothetical protein